MTLFRVWAPNAQRVDLVISALAQPMQQREHGWWSLDVNHAGAGDEYGYSLDGGPVRPDPRSMDQPHGVHGRSRLVDHAAYSWRITDFRAPPLSSAVVYELHVGTFTPTGTLDAAIAHLDHLVELGVTHVELMPLNSFDGERGWGYDGVCWYAPQRTYTGPEGPAAVKRFVDACHERGLGVLLDVVYNHLGPSGNYLAEFGPYFSDAYSTPWGPVINLDGAGSDEVRRFICDNAIMWLRDYRFDGLRLDAVHAFFDRSAVHLLEQIAAEVRVLAAQQGRPLVVIAESDLNDPRVVRPVTEGGYGNDAQWSDDFHHALHAVVTGERSGYYQDFGSVAQLAKALRNAYVYDGCYSQHRHRSHGRSPAGLSAHHFLGYAQNHDQIGNRARGDRLAALVSPTQLKSIAAVVLLAPFVPMLFMGEEFGTRRPFQYFTSHTDPALAQAVRTGRRNEFAGFGWAPEDVPDPQDIETFRRSQLDWREFDQLEHRDIFEWHRELIALRRRFRELRNGDLADVHVACNEGSHWIAMRRGRVLLVWNIGDTPSDVAAAALPLSGLALQSQLLSNSSDNRFAASALHIAAHGCLIVEVAEHGQAR
jgi:maltooligosyltrehalose trehalohydrolase